MIQKIGRIIGRILLLLILLVAFIFAAAFVQYPAEYVLRVVRWGESDAFDWQKFPSREMGHSAEPYAWQ